MQQQQINSHTPSGFSEKDLKIMGKPIEVLPAKVIGIVTNILGKKRLILSDAEIRFIINKLAHNIQMMKCGYSDDKSQIFKKIKNFIKSKILDRGLKEVYLTNDEIQQLKEKGKRDAEATQLGIMLIFKEATLRSDSSSFLTLLYSEFNTKFEEQKLEKSLIKEISKVLAMKVKSQTSGKTDNDKLEYLDVFLEYQINKNLSFKTLQLTENDQTDIKDTTKRDGILTKLGLNLIFNYDVGNDLLNREKYLTLIKMNFERFLLNLQDKNKRRKRWLKSKANKIPAKKLKGLK